MDRVLISGFKTQWIDKGKPRLPNNANHVITWQGRDWSGFLTWAEVQERIKAGARLVCTHF